LIWDEAAAERRWLYLQMDGDLRKDLAPLLVYFELRTLILCLRSLETDMPGAMEVNLTVSLLAKEVKKIVVFRSAPESVIGKLERFLADSPLRLHGLAAAYGEGGVQKCEELIWRRYFEQILAFSSHPEVSRLSRSLIDLRNILTMAKCVRWNEPELPGLINGGYVRIRKADQVPSPATLEEMVRGFTGGRQVAAADLHPVNLEPLLYAHLSTAMRRRMRSMCPVAGCMGYIWHIFTVARKRSGRHHAARFAVNFTESMESEQ